MDHQGDACSRFNSSGHGEQLFHRRFSRLELFNERARGELLQSRIVAMHGATHQCLALRTLERASVTAPTRYTRRCFPENRPGKKPRAQLK